MTGESGMDRILVVDDEDDLRAIIGDVLRHEGFAVTEASDGLDAIKKFRQEPPDAVLLDLQMPRMTGLEALKELRKTAPDIPVIILTAHGDVPTAVEAIKSGAYDFTLKPPDFDRLIVTLRRSIELNKLQREVSRISSALESSLEDLLGKSQAIKKVVSQISQVAQTDFSVIIQGETGAGKSVVARAIHSLSRRADRPFVIVDIGLIPDSLVESELFGFRKGAFTGADRNKTGYFETADRGTLFIDEAENMSPLVQSKLLTVIESRTIYPLGSTTPSEVDIRIISATNHDIRNCVTEKRFREDLFYRLGEFMITIPPLRERHEDIGYFARRFVSEASRELNKQIREISDEAMARLNSHSWPGNIRELKNVMRRAVLQSEGDVIQAEHVDILMGSTDADQLIPAALNMKEAVKCLEKKMISEALDKTKGNKTKTADLLGISYRSLFDKIREYGIE
jgi:DNA-binding NtrC family response regulator